MSIVRCANCNEQIDTDYEEPLVDDDEIYCMNCSVYFDFDQAEEDRYNDPRRGQAAAINRENYKEPRQ